MKPRLILLAVTWKGPGLSNPPKDAVTIRIHLENAEVFALTLD